MSPEEAIAMVKKYAAQNGVRKTARIFNLGVGTVSGIVKDKKEYSGTRIVTKVAAAGTMTCTGLGILMFPETCLKLRDTAINQGYYALKREHRPLLAKCQGCKVGEDLCQKK